MIEREIVASFIRLLLSSVMLLAETHLIGQRLLHVMPQMLRTEEDRLAHTAAIHDEFVEEHALEEVTNVSQVGIVDLEAGAAVNEGRGRAGVVDDGMVGDRCCC